MLKDEWNVAAENDKEISINICVLYDADEKQEPAALEVRYSIDQETFVRTFRGIPEGYDAVREPIE